MKLLARLGPPFAVAACSLFQACVGPGSSSSSASAAKSAGAAQPPPTFGGATALEWSRRMSESEMKRNGDRMFYDANPKAKWSESPFYINAEARPWLENADGSPRRAGVSAFGFGGTNFHAALEEYRGVAGEPRIDCPLATSLVTPAWPPIMTRSPMFT